MTLNVLDAALDVYEPGNSSTARADADLTVPNVDIDEARASQRLQSLIDTGQLRINNPDGTYTGRITSGDRLRFLVQREGESGLSHRWSAMARNITYDRLGPTRSQLRAEVDDYVFGVLDTREVINGFEDKPIAGSADAILNTIMADNAPEIDLSGVATVSNAATVVWNGTTLLDAVTELADRADAAVWADGTTLGFEPLSNLSPAFALMNNDMGLHSVRERDDYLTNALRVNGGDGVQVDDSQTTQDGYTTVSNTNRLSVQLGTRKAEVARLDVWTRLTGSGENVVVRIQADDGGAPKDPASRETDIARKTLTSDFLADADYTTFLLPDHGLPDPNPWVLIESDGPTGQDIGVNTTSGAPTYRAYYSYPLDTVVESRDSIGEYGRRENTVRRDSLVTRAQTIDYGRTVLRHSNAPERELRFPADSVRTHDLTPGDIVEANEPDENAVGDFIVTQVSDDYAEGTLETDVTTQETGTL